MPAVMEYINIILLICLLVPWVIFLYHEQQTIGLIRPVVRQVSPGLVWLQLIPLVGQIWQFFLIDRMSRSIEAEIELSSEGSLMPDYPTGLAKTLRLRGFLYTACFIVSVLPLGIVKPFFSIAGFVLWILFWIELIRIKKILKERALLQGRA